MWQMMCDQRVSKHTVCYNSCKGNRECIPYINCTSKVLEMYEMHVLTESEIPNTLKSKSDHLKRHTDCKWQYILCSTRHLRVTSSLTESQNQLYLYLLALNQKDYIATMRASDIAKLEVSHRNPFAFEYMDWNEKFCFYFHINRYKREKNRKVSLKVSQGKWLN